MAGLYMSGNTNSKPVNNNGNDYRHPDNMSPITVKPILGPNSPTKGVGRERDNDNDNDGGRKSGYSAPGTMPKWTGLASGPRSK